MAASINFGIFSYEKTPIDPNYPWDWHKKVTSEHRRARPYYYGDYYPLTRCSTCHDDWLAYQLYRPDLAEGVIVAFRREESAFTHATFRLKGLDPDAIYVIDDADSKQTWQATGKSLAGEGVPIAMDEPRSSRLIFYKKK
jgi:alpha-galactosidase